VRFPCHDLRHRYAIEELRASRDIYDRGRHLGRSTVETAKIYLA
jgi:site-specific recombinase XerC